MRFVLIKKMLKDENFQTFPVSSYAQEQFVWVSLKKRRVLGFFLEQYFAFSSSFILLLDISP